SRTCGVLLACRSDSCSCVWRLCLLLLLLLLFVLLKLIESEHVEVAPLVEGDESSLSVSLQPSEGDSEEGSGLSAVQPGATRDGVVDRHGTDHELLQSSVKRLVAERYKACSAGA